MVIVTILLSSCSNEFSEYEKNGPTDLEKAELRGPVKEVVTYWNGEISTKEYYNKWGFYTRREKYDDGELSETIEYEYDEKGLLTIETSTAKNGDKRVYSYLYDEKQNPTKTTYYTIIDGNKGVEQFSASHENTYDENGNLIKVVEKNSSSTPIGNYSIKYYNLGKKIIREDNVDEQGRTKAFMAYEYYANGDLYKTIFLYSNGQVHDYWEEIYEPTTNGNMHKPCKRLHIWPDNPNNYWEQNIQYNEKGDCIVFDNGGDPNYDNKYTYQYDDKNNWIYKKTEGLREEMLFDDNKGGTQSFAEEKREIKYY